MTLADFQRLFAPALLFFTESALKDCDAIVADATIASILAQIRPLAESGKRLRPYLTHVMRQGTGNRDDLHLETGVELFHLFALIHDDVMDRADTRHGVSTMHAHARNLMTNATGDITRMAESHAILAGDLVLSLVHDALLAAEKRQPLAPDRAARVRGILSAMTREVILGQMLDIDLTTRDSTDWATLERKNLLKTARYSVIRPMQLGAAAAGADEKTMDFCETFGRHLGIAFQIQDDLLDVLPPEGGGKPAFNDLKENQHTVFTQYIAEQGSSAQQETLRRLRGHALGNTEREEAVALFTKAGALEHGRTLIAEHLHNAEAALVNAPVAPETVTELRTLVALMRDRPS